MMLRGIGLPALLEIPHVSGVRAPPSKKNKKCSLADEAYVEGVLQGAPSQPKVQFYCASVRGGGAHA
jgi:hypothetical protein